MFRPELRYLIQRDIGEIAPLVTQERIQVMIDVIVCILTLTIVPTFMYDIIIAICRMFWNLLTPGQQLIEILIMIGCIGILVLVKLITDELTTSLVKKFDHFKGQNAEKEKRIAELEEENAALKKKIEDIEKKDKEATISFKNINKVEEDPPLHNPVTFF